MVTLVSSCRKMSSQSTEEKDNEPIQYSSSKASSHTVMSTIGSKEKTQRSQWRNVFVGIGIYCVIMYFCFFYKDPETNSSEDLQVDSLSTENSRTSS